MLKSYIVCDCCGKALKDTGLKLIQPVAISPLPINGASTLRLDMKGQDFCSSICLETALRNTLSKLVRKETPAQYPPQQD